MNRVASWILLAVSLPLPFGCELIAGIEERDEVIQRHPVEAGADATVAEAGIEAAVDAPDEASSQCLEHPPGPPKPTGDAGEDAGQEFVVALRSMDFGAGGPAGFDLDGVATECSDGLAAQPTACKQPDVALQDSWCDGECGRDLAGNALLNEPAASAAIGLGELSPRMENGELGLVLRIGEYNGLANDSAVAVASFVSAGTVLTADGGRPKPQWDGTDQWTAVDTLATKKYGVLYSLTNAKSAYVTDGVLVASFASLQLGFSARSGRLTVFEIDDAVVTGKVQSAGGLYSITNGRIGGAATVSKMLRLVQSLPLEGAFPYLCPGVVAYDYIKENACSRVDLRFPRTSEFLACNALGIGVAFTASSAQLATELSTIPISSPGCNDGGDADDDCP